MEQINFVSQAFVSVPDCTQTGNRYENELANYNKYVESFRSDFVEISNFVLVYAEVAIPLWLWIGSALTAFVILICVITGLAKVRIKLLKSL